MQMDNNYSRFLNSLQNEPLMFKQMFKIVKISHIENMGILVIRIQSIHSNICPKLSFYS